MSLDLILHVNLNNSMLIFPMIYAGYTKIWLYDLYVIQTPVYVLYHCIFQYKRDNCKITFDQ